MKLRESQAGLSAEGTRTGDWFAVGDVHPELVPPSFATETALDAPRAPAPRRLVARWVGALAIAGMLFCLVRFARYAPVRNAILQWGLFGQSARVLSHRAP